jgi:hypothetical protein
MDGAQIAALLRELRSAEKATTEIIQQGGEVTVPVLLQNQMMIIRSLVAILEVLRAN